MRRDLRTILGDELLEDPLMQQALTHRSAAAVHNERLEFLGDAVLGWMIAQWVYSEFPSLDEGGLSKSRSHLVREETLARLAKQIDITPLIVVGDGELSGRRAPWRESLLADTFEAVIGALYLLCGIDKTERIVHEIFSEMLANLPPVDVLKDAKTKLQEHLQKQGDALPAYTMLGEDDESGGFQVRCTVASLNIHSHGEGLSKRKAEQQAAEAMLGKLLIHRDR